MAGGMRRKSDGLPRETLAQRVANTQVRTAGDGTREAHGTRSASRTAPTQPPAAPDSPPQPLRHCWYNGPHGQQAALLLKWRNVDGHYDGLIVVASPDAVGAGWAVVEMWTDSALLTPA